MVKHIVFWRLKDDVTGAARESALRTIKEGFEAMQGQIPGLRRIEIGVDFGGRDDSVDFALYSEFESRAALDVYQNHPLHQALMPIVSGVRSERRIMDYEV